MDETLAVLKDQLNSDPHCINELKSTKGMVEAEASSLFLLSDGGKNLELTIPTGPATAEVSGKKIASDHGISGWVVQHQQPVLITDVQSDPRFQGELLSNPKFQSRNMICVPLNNNQGKTIGVLQAINIKEKFRQDTQNKQKTHLYMSF